MAKMLLKKEPKLAPKLQAFQYQTEAAVAIRDLPYGAVFHEQGLGKSKIAIDIILYWLETHVVDTVILVAKKGLVDNWKRELDRHSFLSPRVLSSNRRDNYFVLNSPARLILTHYEAVRAELPRLKLFLKARKVAVILDESTKIKNPDSDVTKAFFDLALLFERRVILTGTPVANRPYDLWAQIYFLDQGKALGTKFGEFKRSYDLTNSMAHDVEGREEFEQSLQSVRSKLADFTVRENKNSKFIQLPTKSVQAVWVDWEPAQYDLYTQYRDSLGAIIIRDGVPSEDRADDILKRLLRLVQIASNPMLVDKGYSQDPGKWPVLADLLDQIRGQNEKAIVWTTFTENADWIKARLSHLGAVAVHGGMSMDDRNRSVRKFIESTDCQVFVATPGAAKEGLTLTVANHVIFFDRSFSLDDYLQAQDRIHRVSQTRECYVYNLMMQDSVDGWIDVLLHAKRLAAQLAQGDISFEYYQSQMTYSFGEVLKGILNIA